MTFLSFANCKNRHGSEKIKTCENIILWESCISNVNITNLKNHNALQHPSSQQKLLLFWHEWEWAQAHCFNYLPCPYEKDRDSLETRSQILSDTTWHIIAGHSQLKQVPMRDRGVSLLVEVDDRVSSDSCAHCPFDRVCLIFFLNWLPC